MNPLFGRVGTIGVEVSFYCLFPILLSLSKNIKFWLILLIFSTGISYFIPQIVTDLNFRKVTASCVFPANIFIFISGGLVYFLHIKFRTRRTKYLSLILSSAFMLIWAATIGNQTPAHIQNFLPIIKTFTLSSFVFYFCDSNFFYNRLTRLLGELSYSIYLIHPIVIMTLKPYLGSFYRSDLPVEVSFVVASLMVLIVTCIISYFINKYFEAPIYKYGVKKAVMLENG